MVRKLRQLAMIPVVTVIVVLVALAACASVVIGKDVELKNWFDKMAKKYS